MGLKPSFSELYVSTLLVDPLLLPIQWNVFIVSAMSSPVRFILPLMELLPYWSAKILIDEDQVAEWDIQLFLNIEVRLSHAQNFLLGFPSISSQL